MVSTVVIAGIIISLLGASYLWAIPMIEKRVTINDYNLVEGFMLDLNEKIVEIANSGSGTSRIDIPKGILDIKGYDYFRQDLNNHSP